MNSIPVNVQLELETTQTVCGRLCPESRTGGGEAIRLTKVSLIAFNGAKRAHIPMVHACKSSFWVYSWNISEGPEGPNGAIWKQSVSEESERRERRDHTGLTLCHHTHTHTHTHTHKTSRLTNVTLRRSYRKDTVAHRWLIMLKHRGCDIWVCRCSICVWVWTCSSSAGYNSWQAESPEEAAA